MNRIVALLAAVLWSGVAIAAQAPDTPVVTGPNMQQIPIGNLYVTPTGGTQQKLGDALAAPTGNVSATTSTATGSTTARTQANRAADVFNVMDYGAKCDNGVTNDNTAINAALTAAFNSTAYQSNNAVSIVGPAGSATSACLMNSLNLTQFNKGTGSNTRPRVDFGNMTLLCTGAGNVCIDSLGADFVKLHDLSVRGDPTAPPAICVQFGVISVTSAAWHTVDRVNCNSEFTFAAYYNFGSEAVGSENNVFVNNHSGSGPINAVGTVTPGTGGSSGFFNNVALTGGTGHGATANFTVAAGGVTVFTIAYQGRDYAPGDVLSAASGDIGNTVGFSVPVSTTKSFIAIDDGQNHWRATSAFVTETLPVETWQSLTLGNFTNTNFRQTAVGGGGVWVGWTGGLHLINSYILSAGASCMEVFDNGVTKSGIPGPNWGLDLDFNCEGAILNQAILFTGSHAAQTFQSFKFKGYHQANYLFGTDTGITSVALNAANIDMQFGNNGTGNTPVFSSAKLFSLSGSVAVPAANQWNAPLAFAGQLVAGGVATPPNLGPLDIISGAGIALTCARNTNPRVYKGPLCRVQRASDSTQIDLYADAFGNLDPNAFTAFCNGTTCSLATMYDQSGNANNCTQSTTASQPVIALSTSSLGGRPSLTFGDQSAFACTVTHAASIDDLFAAGGYISTVVSPSGAANAADRLFYKTNGGNTIGWEYRNNFVGSSMTLLQNGATSNGTWATTAISVAGHIQDIIYSNASQANVPTIALDGTNFTLSSPVQPVGAPGSDAVVNLIIGNNAATAGTRGYPGSVAEVVMWKITPSALQLEAIRRNQAAYYGLASVN
jgi:hypothetical protein